MKRGTSLWRRTVGGGAEFAANARAVQSMLDRTGCFHAAGWDTRKLTVIWNVVPWWNGTRKLTAKEVHEGAICVTELIGLLPKLRAIVMVGQKAIKARRWLETTGLHLFTSDHPGPLVRTRWPERWKAIPYEWAKIREFIDVSDS
jgi:uracil-DNA glycosylase